MNYFSNRRVAFVCLGCKLNFAESSTWAREFVAHGYKRVDVRVNMRAEEGANIRAEECAKVRAEEDAEVRAEEGANIRAEEGAEVRAEEDAEVRADECAEVRAMPDLVVINTCSVTEQAEKKCRQAIRHLHRMAPEARLAVTGCYAQLKAEELFAMEGVDLVVGTEMKSELFSLTNALITNGKGGCFYSSVEDMKNIFPAYSSGDRTRSFLKVQDGCDYHCTYCTVPLARGASRNVPVMQLGEQARALAAGGVKEVVLTGVNTGDFGKSTGESFVDLLKSLAAIEEIRRWRISSIEPNLLTQEILEWISQTPSFLPHFHLPLQSGSNKILAQMRRRYNRELFADRVAHIRTVMPDAFIGVDVIVGFPGEGETEFEETVSFLTQLSPSFLHVFPYSRRDNTPAAASPHQVPQAEKRARVTRLTHLSNKLYRAFYDQNRGREEEVLFEAKERGGMMSGFTRNYLRIEQPFQKELIGEIVQIRVP